MPSQAVTNAALQRVAVIAIAIRDLGSVPSGHLYAGLMGYLTLEQYETIIGILKRARMVTESGHLITWVGPKKEAQ